MSEHAERSLEWRNIEQIFDAALELETGERAGFVAEVCADDAALRREVESLLAAYHEAGDFLASPIEQATAAKRAALQRSAAKPANGFHPSTAAERIGPYRLLRELAQGGMGAVWLAERADAQFDQQVAIKLLKADAASEELLHRFRHERQVLAGLNHPNIARLLDGGTTEDGRPYIVMEYIEGLPLDEYCDREQLALNARLQLFRQVCAAVHYAHQNLLVHRDLKPGNILVTAEGTPKLLDFGIAKLLQPDPAQASLTGNTLTGFNPMTPAYASPEQVRGEKLTTASDVYSLGVVLYELLTSHTPYQLKANSFGELVKAICEQEPARPSTAAAERMKDEGGRMKTTASALHPSSLILHPSSLRGDVDSIVLMALRKEPSARYGSVEQFSEDIRRYLEGLPTIARKGTFSYRAAKYLRRNRIPVAAAALILLTLLAGIGATLRQARIALAAQHNAEAQQAKAETQRQRAEAALASAEDRRQQAEAARNEANQQRAEAEAQRELANEQRTFADSQRLRAESQELSNRRLLYSSQMKLAQTAWDESNVERVRELLSAHIPKQGQVDLRGFEWNWLWRISHMEVADLLHKAPSSYFAFTADGKRLITYDVIPTPHQHLFRVWDTTTWQEKYQFGGLGSEIGDHAAFSPDGALVAATLENTCGLTVWETAAGRRLGKYLTSECMGKGVLFSPDGKKLAGVTRENDVILLDPRTGQLLLKFKVKAGGPYSGVTYTFSPDGKTIAAANSDNFIRFWDSTTGQELSAIQRKESILMLAFSPNGHYLALGSVNGDVVIQDLTTRQDVFSFKDVAARGFSPDGRYFAGVGIYDRQIRVWETGKWQEVASFKGHNNRLPSLIFSPDSKRLVTTSGAVKVWDLNTRQSPISFSLGQVFARHLEFSPDSSRLFAQGYSPFTAGNFVLTKVWDIRTMKETGSIMRANTMSPLYSWSKDGEKIAFGDNDQNIVIRNAANGNELLKFKVSDNYISDISWSSDGRMIAAPATDRAPGGELRRFVKIFDARIGRELYLFPSTDDIFYRVAFLPDNRTLVITGSAYLYLYDFGAGKILKKFPKDGGDTSAMKLSADGRKVALGFRDGSVRLFDISTGEEILALRGHGNIINQLSFSADGRRLATSSFDNTTRVWDLVTKQELLLFRETAQQGGVAFSPDGQYLAVAYPKGLVKVFTATDPKFTEVAGR